MEAILLVVGAMLLSLALVESLLHWLDVADPPVFISDPHAGYVMAPNQSVSTRGTRFRINNLGLRGDDVPPS